jgi:tetratricopeptide (TPR) repeat protein
MKISATGVNSPRRGFTPSFLGFVFRHVSRRSNRFPVPPPLLLECGPESSVHEATEKTRLIFPRASSPTDLQRIAIVLVLLLGVLVRLVWPLADPPDRISWSSGIYTDPAAKTLPARDAIEHGDWSREESPYLSVFPLANALTWMAYRLFGVNRLSHQFLGVLVSLVGLLAVILALRRGCGIRAAVCAAVLGGLSFWLIAFSRIPVVEHLVATLLALGCLFAAGRRTRDRVTAGALAVTAVLFGKYHAVGFLPGLVVFVSLRERSVRKMAHVVAGGSVVFLIWVVALFLPQRQEIVAYVQHVATGMQGPPPLLHSPLAALFDLFRSIHSAWVFHQAPVLGILGAGFAVWTLSSRETLRTRVEDGSAIFAFWFLGMWVYYALLSYQAPRYYVVVALPLVACAAAQLSAWLEGRWSGFRRPRSLREMATAAIILYMVGFMIVDALRHALSNVMLYERTRTPGAPSRLFSALGVVAKRISTPEQALLWALPVAAILGLAALVWARWTRVARTRASSRIGGRRLAIAALVFAVVLDGVRFADWGAHRKYAIEEIKSAIPSIIAADSVVLGSFAALVTQGSRIAAFTYLDPASREDVLAGRGVTHVLMDDRHDPASLTARAPDLESRLEVIHSWPVRTRNTRTLRLYRLRDEVRPAGERGNQPTLFERAAREVNRREWRRALELLEQHRRERGEETPEVLLKEATCWYSLGQRENARERLVRALELRPEHPEILHNLGLMPIQEGDTDAAREYWVRGLRCEPHNTDFIGLIRRHLQSPRE